MSDVHIIGWGHTRFGRHDALGVEDLLTEAVRAALDHAQVEAKDIDAIFVGQMNGGFDAQNFISSPEEGGRGLTFPGIFARFAQAYFALYGDHSEGLAQIAVKNHANGVRNPYAHFRKKLELAFCRTPSEKNPVVAPPLKVTDCSAISDGAAAVVLADTECAWIAPRRVKVRARVQVNDLLPMSARALVDFEGPARAWTRALDAADCALEDLHFAEVHDCFTIAELLSYEAMGLAPRGQGARAIAEGWTAFDGRFPVNPSGGLKAKGHPIGATGVSMHVMAAMQLCGEAGDFQLPRADRAGVFNMGGSAVANYVSILEAAGT